MQVSPAYAGKTLAESNDSASSGVAADTLTPATRPADRPGTDIMQLTAGDEDRVSQGRIVKTIKPDVRRALAWRARRLMFPGDRIADIVEEFNRYNRTRIRIEGAAIRERRMSGVFDADDPSPLIQHLARDADVEIVKSENEILIRSRSDGEENHAP